MLVGVALKAELFPEAPVAVVFIVNTLPVLVLAAPPNRYLAFVNLAFSRSDLRKRYAAVAAGVLICSTVIPLIHLITRFGGRPFWPSCGTRRPRLNRPPSGSRQIPLRPSGGHAITEIIG